MKNRGRIRLLFVVVLALLILAGTGAAVSLSNSGGGMWKYQRDISIKENSKTTLTDYQVLIELTGADFPGEAKSDGVDIRFTDSKGKELNYWIESWDYIVKSANIWVKMPSISAGSTAFIRMYYGNPSASAASNGKTTFIDYDENKVNGSFNTNMQNSEGFVINTNVAVTALQSREGPQISFDITGRGLEQTNIDYYNLDHTLRRFDYSASTTARNGYYFNMQSKSYEYTQPSEKIWEIRVKNKNYWFYIDKNLQFFAEDLPNLYGTILFGGLQPEDSGKFYWIFVRKYASSEPTITLSTPKSSSLSITKSSSPYSLRQFQESTIKVLIENSGTSEVKAVEIMDSIHPSFDLTGGDFPNPKKFDSIRAGESRELQYTIKSKESGSFTLDPATVTYADSEENIQEIKSEPVSIKVVPSSDGGSSDTNTGQNSKSASVSLHGEKTDVVMGEDILLRLSAVNLITKPKMHVQVIIIPPSGMSVTSSEFSKSAAGQFTANYQLEPGDGKDIEVRIRSNQVGDFNVNGRIIYYFGDDKEKAEDQTLNLPIKVRKELVETVPSSSNAENSAKASGFGGGIAIIGLFMAIYIRKRS